MGVIDEQENSTNGSIPPLRQIQVEGTTAPISVAERVEVPEFIDQQAEYEEFDDSQPEWFEQIMRTESLSISFAGKKAVKEVSLPVNAGEVLALIGPSGCGKTTLLRSLNKLVDLTPTATREGRILLDGTDTDLFDDTYLRRRVGMLFQQPNPFPMTIFDNIAYGLRERGSKRPRRKELEPVVVQSLAAGRALGTRSRTTSITRPSPFPAASSSASASPARWRSPPRFYCSTSPVPLSIRSPRQSSKKRSLS